MATTTTTTTSSSTTTTTLAAPPLPTLFNSLTGTLQSTLSQPICDALQEAAQFDSAFVQFYNWMFNQDGSPGPGFQAMICNILQNCGTTLAGGTTTPPVLQTWTAVGSALAWSAVCLSADGTKGAACVNSGGIYISTDGALQTWTLVSGTSTHAWTDICCSNDFTSIYASNGTDVFLSTNSGGSFSSVTSGEAYTCVTCSANGQIAYAGYSGGYQFTINQGGAFSTVAVAGYAITEMSMSGDGETVIYWASGKAPVALAGSLVGGTLGVTSGTPTTGCIASPAVGHGGTFYLASGGVPVLIFVNNGLNTVSYSGTPNYTWAAVACSSDGTSVVVAVGPANQIQLSQDTGSTFTAVATIQNWVDVALSASGQVGLAAVNGGQLYVGT